MNKLRFDQWCQWKSVVGLVFFQGSLAFISGKKGFGCVRKVTKVLVLSLKRERLRVDLV